MANRFESLTGGERLVLASVLQGRLNKQITGILGIHDAYGKSSSQVNHD